MLAYEFTHVAAGIDAEHGPAWEAAFAAIHAEYRRLAELSGMSLEDDVPEGDLPEGVRLP